MALKSGLGERQQLLVVGHEDSDCGKGILTGTVPKNDIEVAAFAIRVYFAQNDKRENKFHSYPLFP